MLKLLPNIKCKVLNVVLKQRVLCDCTDCGQGSPGLVARSEEGEASWTFDLLPEFGSVRVHLSGGGSHHTQSVVDVHQRQRYMTHTLTLLTC